MSDFIAWLQNLTAELKKPREEQEGFAWALTESIHGLKAFFDGVRDSYVAMTDWWSGVETYWRRQWEKVKAAVDFGAWVNDEVVGWGFNFYVAMTDWWSGIATFFRREWEKVKAAVDFEWLNKVSSFVGGIFGGGGGAATATAPVGPPLVPSLFTPVPSQFAPAPSAGGGNASIIVDFRNTPRGTLMSTRADSNTDLEVNTGYAMQGAQ